jgi:hypothetical protein
MTDPETFLGIPDYVIVAFGAAFVIVSGMFAIVALLTDKD